MTTTEVKTMNQHQQYSLIRLKGYLYFLLSIISIVVIIVIVVIVAINHRRSTMSTTFNLRSWSIDILNVTVIHHSSLWLSMCRSTMSTTFKSPIVVVIVIKFVTTCPFLVLEYSQSFMRYEDWIPPDPRIFGTCPSAQVPKISDRGLSVFHHPSSRQKFPPL